MRARSCVAILAIRNWRIKLTFVPSNKFSGPLEDRLVCVSFVISVYVSSTISAVDVRVGNTYFGLRELRKTIFSRSRVICICILPVTLLISFRSRGERLYECESIFRSLYSRNDAVRLSVSQSVNSSAYRSIAIYLSTFLSSLPKYFSSNFMTHTCFSPPSPFLSFFPVSQNK